MPESLRFVLLKGKLQNIIQTLDRMKQINLWCKICNNSSQQEIRSFLLNDLDKIENEGHRQQYFSDVNESGAKLCRRPWMTRCLVMSIA